MSVEITDKLMQQAKVRVRDGFIAIALCMVLLLGLRVSHETYLSVLAAEQREELLLADEIMQLHGEIRESIAMHILTQDQEWRDLHDSKLVEIAAAAKRLTLLAPEAARKQFQVSMKEAAVPQVESHLEIFRLVEIGETTGAGEVLSSQAYKNDRVKVLSVFDNLDAAITTNLERSRKTETIIVNALTVVLLSICMMLVYRRQKLLFDKDKKQLSRIADDFRHLNEENTVLANLSTDQEKQIAELAAVAEKTSNLVLLYDAEQNVRWVNKAFSDLTGLTLTEVAGRTFPMPPVRKQNVDELMAGIAPLTILEAEEELGTEQISGRFDTVIPSASGKPLWLDIDKQIFEDDSGATTGYIIVGTDLSQHKEHEFKIANYATDMKRFAHIASHDLKEPLRQINDYMRLLHEADSADDDELKARCMEVMEKAVNRGRNLVSDLLRFAKIQDRSLEKHFEPLEETLELIIEQMKVCSFRGDVSFDINIPKVLINADSALLQSVIQNLMSNAVKYTALDRPNLVSMGFENRGSYYCLYVSDTGIGFTEEQSATIFEPFKRLVSKKDFAGSGVGLSIVSSIIQKHGWQVIASGEENVGARLEIHIPARDVSMNEMNVNTKKEAA